MHHRNEGLYIDNYKNCERIRILHSMLIVPCLKSLAAGHSYIDYEVCHNQKNIINVMSLSLTFGEERSSLDDTF